MASGATPVQGLPYPAPLDGVNVDGDLKALALALDTIGVLSFASASERGQKLPAPKDSTISFLRDVRRYEWFNAAINTWTWLAGGGAPYLQLHQPSQTIANGGAGALITGWQVEVSSDAFAVNGDGSVQVLRPMTVSAMAKFISDNTNVGQSAVTLAISSVSQGVENTTPRSAGFAGAGLLRQTCTHLPVFAPAGTTIRATAYQANVDNTDLSYNVWLQVSGQA